MIIFFSLANLSTSLEVNTTVLFDVNRSPHVVVSIEVKCMTDSDSVYMHAVCVCIYASGISLV